MQINIAAKAKEDVIDCERKVRPVVKNIIRQGCNGVIARIAWFHRSNVPVAIAQASGLPLIICAISNHEGKGIHLASNGNR